MIYLDYAAGTPVDQEVLDLFYETTKKYYANPNSSHQLGKLEKNMIDQSTSNILKNMNLNDSEVIYTSGASESNNLALKGICERYKNYGKHILISSLEHNSIVSSATNLQELGFEVELIPVNKQGFIEVETLKQMIREDTILVSVCSVDSEIGLRQPIEEIGLMLKEYPHCYFHSDASQSIGKVNIDYTNVDLITITPHKFYGLNGFGMLIKKKIIGLKPQINGGKSTTIYRSGTPCLADIIACDKALEIALKKTEERYQYIKSLNEKIKNHFKIYPDVRINSTDYSIPHTLNFSVKGIKALSIQEYLEKKQVYVSTKTSCCPIETPSKLVYALTHDKGISSSSVRISLSHLTKEKEIDEFLEIFDIMMKEFEENGKI